VVLRARRNSNFVQDTSQLKLIASLRFEPGYLLLLDWLQAQQDNLTDSLGAPGDTPDQSLAKLQYWRAHRDILHTLRVQPQNFAAALVDENPDPELPTPDANSWAKLQAAAQQYYSDQLPQ
jgi:hypothetical protein